MSENPFYIKAAAEAAEISADVLPAEPVGAEGEFTGLASTFDGQPDAMGDIVRKGAFAQSLATQARSGRLPVMLWSHDLSQPIGRWIEIQETSAGLFVRGRLNLEVQRAREARALLLDGGLGLSIGYSIVEAKSRPGGGKELLKVDLHEISLVSIPANPAARVVEAKSAAPEFGSARDLERWLREHGMAKAAAKAVTAHGWRGLASADSIQAEQRAAAIKAAINQIRVIRKEQTS